VHQWSADRFAPRSERKADRISFIRDYRHVRDVIDDANLVLAPWSAGSRSHLGKS
jgi:hypothetical protein